MRAEARGGVGSSLSWVEVDLAALRANLASFRARIRSGVELAHVVKANAYGHGLLLVAADDQASGIADRLAVNSVEELVRLREAGVRLPVLLLGYVPLHAWDEVVEAGGAPVVFHRESLEAVSRASAARGRETAVHLKVETGTHRYGVPPEEVLELVELAGRLPGIRVEGITTHFANIEDTTDHGYAMGQLERFRDALRRIEAAGWTVPVPHTACSAAAILFPESQFGLVRVGISSYGIWPSKETRVSAAHLGDASFRLARVLTWKTRVAQVKRVPAGSYVGYGCTWRAPVDSTLAVLPLGYADGYDRELGNAAHVLIGGCRAPVRGRVCMNVLIADVTHVPGVGLEDEVVLLGAQGDEEITADQLAVWAGTIAYEIVARIGEHLPRVAVAG